MNRLAGPVFESQRRQEILSKPSKPVLGSTELPTRVLTMGSIDQGVKLTTPSSKTEVKNEWSYTSTRPVYICGLHSESFTYAFTSAPIILNPWVTKQIGIF